MLANSWRQMELVSILTKFFVLVSLLPSRFLGCDIPKNGCGGEYELVNSNVTCERLANLCYFKTVNQSKHALYSHDLFA